MKPLVIIGLVLVVLGIAALGYQGVAYITTRETVAKVGPVEVQADRQHAIPLAPIVSGAAVLGGVVLLIAAAGRPNTG
jgi:hypothetical protein